MSVLTGNAHRFGRHSVICQQCPLAFGRRAPVRSHRGDHERPEPQLLEGINGCPGHPGNSADPAAADPQGHGPACRNALANPALEKKLTNRCRCIVHSRLGYQLVYAARGGRFVEGRPWQEGPKTRARGRTIFALAHFPNLSCKAFSGQFGPVAQASIRMCWRGRETTNQTEKVRAILLGIKNA